MKNRLALKWLLFLGLALFCGVMVAVVISTSAPAITIRTNLDVGARFQIPEACGVFLLDTGHDGGNRTAVILSAKLPRGKK